MRRALFESRKKYFSTTYPLKNECYNRFNNQDFCFLEMMNLLIDGKTDFWTFLLCKTVTKEKTISIVIDIHTVCQRLKISIVNIKFVKHRHLLFIDILVSQLILSLYSIIALSYKFLILRGWNYLSRTLFGGRAKKCIV